MFDNAKAHNEPEPGLMNAYTAMQRPHLLGIAFVAFELIFGLLPALIAVVLWHVGDHTFAVTVGAIAVVTNGAAAIWLVSERTAQREWNKATAAMAKYDEVYDKAFQVARAMQRESVEQWTNAMLTNDRQDVEETKVLLDAIMQNPVEMFKLMRTVIANADSLGIDTDNTVSAADALAQLAQQRKTSRQQPVLGDSGAPGVSHERRNDERQPKRRRRSHDSSTSPNLKGKRWNHETKQYEPTTYGNGHGPNGHGPGDA